MRPSGIQALIPGHPVSLPRCRDRKRSAREFDSEPPQAAANTAKASGYSDFHKDSGGSPFGS